MVRLIFIAVYFISLVIAVMCGIAAIVISVAIVTGKLNDPEAWKTAAFLAAVACLLWFLCRTTWRLSE
jgi:TRAP-type mannitol/chloroaromatic compound transport system permease small subunit